MDRRTVLAIVLSIGVVWGWQKFYIEPRMPKPNPTAVVSATQSDAATAPGTSNPTATTPSSKSNPSVSPSISAADGTTRPAGPRQTRTLKTATGEVTLSDGQRAITGWRLSTYQLGIEKESAAVDLASVTHQGGGLDLAFDNAAFAYLGEVQGQFSEIQGGFAWTYEDTKVKLVREMLASPERNYLDVTVRADFKSEKPGFMFLSVSERSPDKDPEATDRQLVYFSNQEVERFSLSSDVELTQSALPAKFVAGTSRYFTFAIVNTSPLDAKALVQPIGTHTGRASLVFPIAGSSVSVPTRVYFGPKELDQLRAVEPTLDHVVNFGFFTWLAYPLLRLLRWFHDMSGNYGVAIILLTLLLRLVTYPLTYKSVKSMKEMAKIQPQLQKLRDKHKDDREALNREMLTLMRTHGYNPVAGCLPILVQMPVFFALYQVLWGSIELYHAPFAFWIRDLSTHDPFYITPVLLTLTMYLQQRLTPMTATDPAQVKMLQLMPLIFGAMMLWLPSGLTLYMLVSALAGIVQQLILNKKFDIHPNAPVAA
jgi:YidC/Oxa1 family membrane protein insertase